MRSCQLLPPPTYTDENSVALQLLLLAGENPNLWYPSETLKNLLNIAQHFI
jgi:hypothetical protein